MTENLKISVLGRGHDPLPNETVRKLIRYDSLLSDRAHGLFLSHCGGLLYAVMRETLLAHLGAMLC